ncbi:MAG: hypothetical protein QOG61_1599 [Candidatus Binataceae bacterium]|jgi:membrane-associated phospholipid phosphatase|nr:hypothetical protein [Candidatus Binataceae bacterium]
MNKQALAWMAAVAASVALISVFAFDRGLALAVHHSGIESLAFIVRLREFFDALTGRGLASRYGSLSQLLIGVCLILAGLLWALARRANPVARALIFTGIVQIGTIEAVANIKDVFGRLRPYQIIASDDWNHVWFAGGNSFPSGHVAFFWGLFLPLAYLYPRYRIALLAVPLFIGLERIDENVHFLSDVLGSITVAALVTLAAALAFGRWIRPAVVATP